MHITLYSYNLLILGILLFMALLAAVNMLTFRRVRAGRKPHSFPYVSVLIPARNEQDNIGICLSSLVSQDYPRYEIVVLDDNSEDATGDIVRDWEGLSDRVRYLKGSPLPPGWVGKCFACHQLSKHARGELLLFTDADTMHSSQSISSAVAAMHKTRADLLTVVPFLTLKTFWEKTVMPMLHFVTFCSLPFPLVHLSRNPRFAMANGQFMLFKRDAYEAIGGHEAVKNAMVEDIWLSRLIKKEGYSLRVMDGVSIVATRMYRSLREIWDGFSKNIFPGFKYSLPSIVVVMLFNVLTSVLPFVFLGVVLLSPVRPEWSLLVLMQILMLFGIRLMLAHKFKLNLLATFTHPLGMGVVAGIAFNSTRWALFSGGMRWKGRTYDFRLRTEE